MILRNFWQHRRWVGIMAAGLVLLAAKPLVEAVQDQARLRGVAIAQEQMRVKDMAARYEEDRILAQKPEGQLSADDIDHLLMPVDRLRVVAGLERQAAAAHLSHFAYVLSPEKPSVAIIGGDMAESDLTVSADLPLDGDAAVFIRSLDHILPGRVSLRRLTLSRLTTDAPLSLANIHMEAELIWLSNKATLNSASAQ